MYNFILFFLAVLHSIRLTHTDLKPENMLFVNSDYDVYWNENLVCLISSDFMEHIYIFSFTLDFVIYTS